MSQGTLICTQCKREMPVDEFYEKHKGTGVYNQPCRWCRGYQGVTKSRHPWRGGAFSKNGLEMQTAFRAKKRESA